MIINTIHISVMRVGKRFELLHLISLQPQTYERDGIGLERSAGIVLQTEFD